MNEFYLKDNNTSGKWTLTNCHTSKETPTSIHVIITLERRHDYVKDLVDVEFDITFDKKIHWVNAVRHALSMAGYDHDI